jgi:hypothetical protein
MSKEKIKEIIQIDDKYKKKKYDLKLYHIKAKKGVKFSPDVPYIVSVSENAARENHCRYALAGISKSEYTCKPVDRLELTEENLMAVILSKVDVVGNGFGEIPFDSFREMLEDYSVEEIIKNEWEEFCSYHNSKINLSEKFNLKKFKDKLLNEFAESNKNSLERIEKIKSDIKKKNESINFLNLIDYP